MTFSNWWAGLSEYFKAATVVLATIVALSAATTAWASLGWWTPASRAFVRSELSLVAAPVLGLAQEQRDRLRRTRDGLVARLALATTPQARDDLKQLIAQAEQDIADVEARIKVLEGLRRD